MVRSSSDGVRPSALTSLDERHVDQAIASDRVLQVEIGGELRRHPAESHFKAIAGAQSRVLGVGANHRGEEKEGKKERG